MPGILDLVSGAKRKEAGSNRETFRAVFTDPKVRAQVETGIKAVQTMMVNNFRQTMTVNNFRTSGRTAARLKPIASQIAQGEGLSVKDLATKAVDTGARWAADILAPHLVSRYVLDPQGVKALTTLARSPNDTAISSALSALLNIALRDNSTQPEGE